MIGVLTFQNYHQRGKGRIGSSVIRGDWLLDDEFVEFKTGMKCDAMIYQKVYWHQHMKDFDGKKILDLCDPDWNSINDDGSYFKLVETASLVDAVTVSSKGLYDYISTIIKDKPVVFVPDRVNLDIIKPIKKHVGKAKEVVWFGYAHNASRALNQVIPFLKKENLSLRVISDGNFQPLYDLGVNIVNEKFQPESNFTQIALGDIVINPAFDDGRWKYKSNNKTVISWALGMPVAQTADDIQRLLDPEERIKEATEKLEVVKAEYDVELSKKQYKELCLT